MIVNRTIGDRSIVLTPVGQLDPTGAVRLRESMGKALADQPPGIICDLGDITPVGTGLSVLLLMADMAQSWPETSILLVAHDGDLLDRLMRLPAADRLPVYPSVADAARHLDRRPAVRVDSAAVAAGPFACRAARRFVERICREWQIDELSPDAAIAVTELVGNVVQHTNSSSVEVRGTLSNRGLRISVKDSSPQLPRIRLGVPRISRPTGLSTLERLSADWGVLPTVDGGKVVWCLLPRVGSDGSLP
jgi:anti-anti-sigma regulatory factor